jgi:hypothetical protein
VCTNDQEFIRKCTKGCLTLNELAAFEELYKVERETKEHLDLDLENPSSNSFRKDLETNDGESEDVDGYEIASSTDISNSSAYFNQKDSVEFYY